MSSPTKNSAITVPAVDANEVIDNVELASSSPTEKPAITLPTVDANEAIINMDSASSSSTEKPTIAIPTVDANEVIDNVDSASSSPTEKPAITLPTVDANEVIDNVDSASSSPTEKPAITLPTVDANEVIDNMELASSSPTEKPAITVPVPAVDADEAINNMELTSSSRPASVAGSDDSDTAAGSVVVIDGVTTDPIVVPYTGPPGHTYEEHTVPADIKDWPVYLSFCEDGPQLSLECVDTVCDDGTPSCFNQMKVSQKLLCDFSGYFKAMFRHEYHETKTGRVQFVDILHEDLMRLKLILMSGSGKANINIGKEEEEMTNLVRVYELADRFDMPVVEQWILERTTTFVLNHRDWKDIYQREIIDAPVASTITTLKEDFHRARLLDFCSAYKRLLDLPERARLVQPSQLATLMADGCHPRLLHSMMHHMNQEAYNGITKVILNHMAF